MNSNMYPTLLIDRHKRFNPKSHFFDRATLRFFGEKVSEMEVLEDTVKVYDPYYEKVHECYVLESIQHNAPGGPMLRRSYFDVNDFSEVIGQEFKEECHDL